MTTIESAIAKIIQFRDERDWKQFHNLKDLAISLSIESNELLENFQWKSTEDAIAQNSDKIKNELADVLIYAIMMANDLDVSIEDIILRKLEINRLKYPVDKYTGTAAKSTEIIDGESLS
jgi:NTP pyrophosphatase (non-canonical NTP hydrolase)